MVTEPSKIPILYVKLHINSNKATLLAEVNVSYKDSTYAKVTGFVSNWYIWGSKNSDNVNWPKNETKVLLRGVSGSVMYISAISV